MRALSEIVAMNAPAAKRVRKDGTVAPKDRWKRSRSKNAPALERLALHMIDIGWDGWHTYWKRVEPMHLVLWAPETILIWMREHPRDPNRMLPGQRAVVLSKHETKESTETRRIYRVTIRREIDDRFFTFEVHGECCACVLLPIGTRGED